MSHRSKQSHRLHKGLQMGESKGPQGMRENCRSMPRGRERAFVTERKYTSNWTSSRDRRCCPWKAALGLRRRKADSRIKARAKPGLGFKALWRTQWISRNTEGSACREETFLGQCVTSKLALCQSELQKITLTLYENSK